MHLRQDRRLRSNGRRAGDPRSLSQPRTTHRDVSAILTLPQHDSDAAQARCAPHLSGIPAHKRRDSLPSHPTQFERVSLVTGVRAGIPVRRKASQTPLRGAPAWATRATRSAPVAQLDRALPSEGKGHTFESCRVRHIFTNCGCCDPLDVVQSLGAESRSSVKRRSYRASRRQLRLGPAPATTRTHWPPSSPAMTSRHSVGRRR